MAEANGYVALVAQWRIELGAEDVAALTRGEEIGDVVLT